MGVTNAQRVSGTRELRKAGVEQVTVVALMGHISIATTQIYTELGEAEVMRVVEKLR